MVAMQASRSTKGNTQGRGTFCATAWAPRCSHQEPSKATPTAIMAATINHFFGTGALAAAGTSKPGMWWSGWLRCSRGAGCLEGLSMLTLLLHGTRGHVPVASAACPYGGCYAVWTAGCHPGTRGYVWAIRARCGKPGTFTSSPADAPLLRRPHAARIAEAHGATMGFPSGYSMILCPAGWQPGLFLYPLAGR